MSLGTLPLGTLPLGTLEVGTGSTSHALDGAATVEATATGDLAHSIPLAGAGLTVATAEGAMSVDISLAGAGVMYFTRPATDVLTGGWTTSSGTGFAALLDEAEPDDSDYVYSGMSSGLLGVTFAPLDIPPDPHTHTGHRLKIRGWCTGGIANLNAVMYSSYAAYLADETPLGVYGFSLSGTPAVYTKTFATALISMVADFSALFVVINPVGDGPVAHISQIWYEVTSSGLATAIGDLSVSAGGTVDLAAAATAIATASGGLSLSIPLSGSAVAQALAQAGLTHVVSLAGAAASGHTVYARPDGVIDGVGYTPVGAATIHECLNEVTPNDATYIYGTADSVEVSLQNMPDPGISTGHVVRFRAKTTDGWLAVALLQGTTTIASKYYYGNFPAVWTDDSFTLTPAEADAITNYNDLRLTLTGLIGTTSYSWAAFSVDVPGVEATGALAQTVLLAGDGSANVTASSDVSINISLSGDAIAEAAAAANISLDGGLSGVALVVASASGDITHTIPLSGAALSTSQATGDLDLSVSMTASAIAEAIAAANLTQGVLLAGDGSAQTTASGDLTHDTTLAGSASVESLALGDFTIQIVLTGTAEASGTAGAELTVAIKVTVTFVDMITVWRENRTIDLQAESRVLTVLGESRTASF